MLEDPRSIGEALRGSRLGEFWKYRVGDWRIICDIQDEKLIILALQIGQGACDGAQQRAAPARFP